MDLTTPRQHERPGGRAVVLSVGAHTLLLAGVWALSALRPPPIEFEAIAITLYSPPPVAAEEIVEAAPPEEELEVETPEPEPDPEDVPLPDAQQEEVAPPPPDPAPEPEPEPETQEEETSTAPVEDPEPAQESGEDINVRMEGVQRDYPAYYNNILTQIDRCFRGSSGQHRAVVRFTILRDGTAEDIEVVESSGNVAFEIRALEAVECAGGGRFGPLPEDLAYDELPILFSFDPRGDN